MNRVKKQIIFILGMALIFFLIIGGIFYWKNHLKKGTLVVSGEAPFTIKTFGQQDLQCQKSPCEAKYSTGSRDFVFEKEGYQTILQSLEISLWAKTETVLDFREKPSLKEVSAIPETQKSIKYSIIFDESAQKDKLVVTDDPDARGLVYFPDRLQNPKTLGDDKTVLVIDDSNAYIVDLLEKSKTSIESAELSNITAGKWSPSGKYLLFVDGENGSYHLFSKEDGTKDLPLISANSVTDWSDEKLYFITSQNVFQEDVVNGSFYFGYIEPKSASVHHVFSTIELAVLPDQFVVSSNGKNLYYSLNNRSFVLTISN